jgi:hypothetical protein
MKRMLIVLCAFFETFFSGCGDYVVKDPLKNLTLDSLLDRGPSISQGMTKTSLLRKWGYPDKRKLVGETKLGAPIEEWTYYAWIPGFPVNYRYVAKEYRLTFQGDILMTWEDTDIIKRKPKDVELKAIENDKAVSE